MPKEYENGNVKNGTIIARQVIAPALVLLTMEITMDTRFSSDVEEWRSLRDDIFDMLKGRNKKYSEVVKEYFKVNPKDEGKKKKAGDGEFQYVNCIERKYWKDPPNNETEKEKDFPDKSRIGAAIFFLGKLQKFLLKTPCDDPDQWIKEHMGQNLLDRFRKEVLNPLKKEIKDEQYKLKKDANGMDEFDC